VEFWGGRGQTFSIAAFTGSEVIKPFFLRFAIREAFVVPLLRQAILKLRGRFRDSAFWKNDVSGIKC
jgi:hypothetical protein